MNGVLRTRPLVWPVIAIVLSILCTVMVTAAWPVDASPAPSESTIVAIAPVRILDTRDPVNVGLAGPFRSPISQKLKVTGSIATTTGNRAPIPVGATGALLNVTAVNTSADGFISIRPGNATGAPTTSSLNVVAGVTVPNSVLVMLPTSGRHAGAIDITFDALGVAGPTTDVLIDVVGYSTSSGLQDMVADVAAISAGLQQVRADVTTNSTGLARVRTDVDTTRAELQGVAADVATKPDATRTVTFNGSRMTAMYGASFGHNSRACTLRLDSRVGWIHLDIPVGSTIVAVTASVLDSAGVVPYYVQLRRVRTTPDGNGAGSLTSATGGAQTSSVGVTHDLTPPATEVVDPGETFDIEFDDGSATPNDNGGNGLCSVAVTYRLPTGP